MTYLHLYHSLHREKRMPFAGLCACVNFSMGYAEQKSFSDIMAPRSLVGLKHHFWGSDDPIYPLHGKFTPLRQNLLLLMAAYNNEL